MSHPLRIGYTLSLTGPLAGNARSARLAHKIWQENINRSGGLLGRPVDLICIDDQADASLVEKIYERLLDEDHIDLIAGGYGTNSLRPAMELVKQRRLFFVGLLGLGVNQELGYDGYFSMVPTGPDPNSALTEGFFSVGAQQSPRPTTVALISADAEFSRNPILGAKENAKRYGFTVVHEQTYPLTTTNFQPVIEQAASSGCDLLFLCSYLADSVGLIRALRESTFQPKMVGASMIGPQNSDVRMELGPLLNGVINYEYWVPVQALRTTATDSFLETYQSRAASEGADLMGHYIALFAYAQMEVIAQAVQATNSLQNDLLIDYSRNAQFDTVAGKVSFGPNGEWQKPRVLQVQFQDIEGNGVEQFLQETRQVILAPEDMQSGSIRYPYSMAF